MDYYCRLCLETDKSFTFVFSDHEGKSIADLIQDCCNISIGEKFINLIYVLFKFCLFTDFNDPLSSLICENCLASLISSTNFREKSIENQKYLNSQQKEKEIENEEIRNEKEPNEDENEEIISYEPATAPPPEDLKIDSETENPKPNISISTNPVKTKRRKFIKPLKLANITTRLMKKQMESPRSRKLFHKCSICSNKFKTNSVCVNHEKLHKMDLWASKVFEDGNEHATRQCSICKKIFNRLHSLRNHWERYHEPKPNHSTPYSCGYCTFRSHYDRLVRRHLKQKHEEMSEEAEIELVEIGIFHGIKLFKGIYVKTKEGNKISNKEFFENENLDHDET
jgi:hypothetical protein